MHQEKASYSVSRMARLLKVSRSGYYKWAEIQDRKAAGQDSREEFQKKLDEKIWTFWDASGQTYGSPRITSDLHDEGILVDKKTVAKAMRRMGIEGISPRSWVPVTTIPGTSTHSFPDLVKRTWDAGELNKVWISDTTYLRDLRRLAVSVCNPGWTFPPSAGLGDGCHSDH